MISRRGLLLGLTSALAAPAIVRAESLMPVRAPALIIQSDDLFVRMMVTDRLTRMPVSLWIEQSDANRVKAGLHPRYSNGWLIGDVDALPRLALRQWSSVPLV